MMSPQTYAITAVGGATLIVAGSRFAAGRAPSIRIFIGGTIAAFTLSIAAGIVPDLVRSLSTLIIIGTVLGAGYGLIQPLARVVRG